MKDKELMLEAIEHSSQYTPKQREILQLFLNIEVNDVVSITIIELAKIINTLKATVYLNLTRLEEDGLVNKISPKGKHFSTFKLNKTNLSDLLKIYLKKKDYLKSI